MLIFDLEIVQMNILIFGRFSYKFNTAFSERDNLKKNGPVSFINKAKLSKQYSRERNEGRAYYHCYWNVILKLCEIFQSFM